MQEIQQVFAKNSFADPDNPSSLYIPKENLLTSLKEFDVGSKDATEQDMQHLDILFDSLDRNSDGRLDFAEFQSAVQASGPLDEWVRSLQLHQLVADAVPRIEGEYPLLTASKLSKEAISKIALAIVPGLERILGEEVQRLRGSFDKMGAEDVKHLGDKFQATAPKMKCGTIEHFHRGVIAQIGTAPRSVFSQSRIRDNDPSAPVSNSHSGCDPTCPGPCRQSPP